MLLLHALLWRSGLRSQGDATRLLRGRCSHRGALLLLLLVTVLLLLVTVLLVLALQADCGYEKRLGGGCHSRRCRCIRLSHRRTRCLCRIVMGIAALMMLSSWPCGRRRGVGHNIGHTFSPRSCAHITSSARR